jgi:hypothetical protein
VTAVISWARRRFVDPADPYLEREQAQRADG